VFEIRNLVNKMPKAAKEPAAKKARKTKPKKVKDVSF
jgi:hypothetical protein